MTPLPVGPKRPGLRRGIECEGRYAGQPTLIVLGKMSYTHMRAFLLSVHHVYWELDADVTHQPWTAVRHLLRDGLTVTVEAGDIDQLRGVPPEVERVLRLPEMIDLVKVPTGPFATQCAKVTVVQVTRPHHYTKDEVLL